MRKPVPRGRAGLNVHQSRTYSQYGEDGILEYLVSLDAGVTPSFVEIGCGVGSESNGARLAIARGWRGLAIDGNPRRAAAAERFYRRELGRGHRRVDVLAEMVTAENINQLIGSRGFSGLIGVLSVDVDGNDYWLVRALREADPRIIVVEYNAAFGPNRVVTSPYAAQFDRFAFDPSAQVYGASLPALTKLANERGYALVGCSAGVNAFFMRKPLPAAISEVSPVVAHLNSLDEHDPSWRDLGWPGTDPRLVEV